MASVCGEGGGSALLGVHCKERERRERDEPLAVADTIVGETIHAVYFEDSLRGKAKGRGVSQPSLVWAASSYLPRYRCSPAQTPSA